MMGLEAPAFPTGQTRIGRSGRQGQHVSWRGKGLLSSSGPRQSGLRLI